jgi:hypothetical protein
MFGWFKKNKENNSNVAVDWEEYKGFRVAATPINEGGQFRVSGIIEQDQEDAEPKRHQFVRADLIPIQDEAVNISLMKAKMMVDQLGARVFDE